MLLHRILCPKLGNAFKQDQNPFGVKTPNDALPLLGLNKNVLVSVILMRFDVIFFPSLLFIYSFFGWQFPPDSLRFTRFFFVCLSCIAIVAISPIGMRQSKALVMQSHLNVLFNGQPLSFVCLCHESIFLHPLLSFSMRDVVLRML